MDNIGFTNPSTSLSDGISYEMDIPSIIDLQKKENNNNNNSNSDNNNSIGMSKKDEVIHAGLKFLKRSKSMKVTSKGEGQTAREKLQRKNSCFTVKELETMTLISAVKDSDAKTHLHDEYVTENKHACAINDCILDGDLMFERRNAICEENSLERNGLLKLLKDYHRLKHLQEYSLT